MQASDIDLELPVEKLNFVYRKFDEEQIKQVQEVNGMECHHRSSSYMYSEGTKEVFSLLPNGTSGTHNMVKWCKSCLLYTSRCV